MHRILACLILPITTAVAEPVAPPPIFEGDPETISKGHKFAEGMAFDEAGNFYFTDVPAGKLFRLDASSGKKKLLDDDTGATNGIAFGPDKRLYGCAGGARRIYCWNTGNGKRSSIAEGPHSNDIAITDRGTIFFTDPREKAVWRVAADSRELTKAAELPWKPNGIALNPAQDALLVAEFASDTVHRLPLAGDDSLGEPGPAYRLAVPADGKGYLDGMVALPSGRLLIGTSRGIQLAAPPSKTGPAGAVIILPLDGRPRCNYVRLSPDGHWLYAAFRDDILRLRLRPDALK